MVRRVSIVACALALLVHVSPPVLAAPTPEYLIKAAYLYNFALFVEWPADAFAGADTPLVIGLVGTDSFDEAVHRTVENKRINRRPIVVKRLSPNQDLRQCHMVFVGASESGRLPEFSSRLDGLPVLLVGESPEFARKGGTVNFTIQDNKVRFEVNVDAARRARLKISAKLLTLATIVRGGQ